MVEEAEKDHYEQMRDENYRLINFNGVDWYIKLCFEFTYRNNLVLPQKQVIFVILLLRLPLSLSAHLTISFIYPFYLFKLNLGLISCSKLPFIFSLKRFLLNYYH